LKHHTSRCGVDIRCNIDAAPDWLADLYRAWRKAEELGAAAAETFRRDLMYCLGCLTLSDFGQSGFAVGFASPVVGGRVWFAADNYGGDDLDGAVYRADELAHLLGAGPDGVKAVYLSKLVFPGSELVGGVDDGTEESEASEEVAPLKVDLSPRDQKVVWRARIALGRLVGEMVSCRACGLGAARTRVVPGEGDASARVMLVGEAPGRQEDATGRPFVGRAGRLLDELLPLAGLDRKRVYIANTVKCRPVGPDGRDRTPAPEEVAACARFLKAQLLLVSPALVVTLGATALDWFLPGFRVGEARGRLHRADGWLVFPTYHPAAALRDDYRRELIEEDFMKLGEVLRSGGADG